MADVVNLRMARKQRARAEKEASAQENRIRHGRPLSERKQLRAEQAAANRHLDGSRIETEAGEP